MSRQHHSKSGLFLMELLINLLLFCFLCGCGLMFFIKSNSLTNDATTLHNAVRITSSIAGIYANGDGSFASLCKVYESADITGNSLYIYFDEEYNPCNKETSVCYVLAEKLDTTPDKIRIDFYDGNGCMSYSIRACNYTPSAFSTVKEVSVP